MIIISCLVISCNNNTDSGYIPMPDYTDTNEPSNAFEHTYTDDDNCTTALYCDECGELLLKAQSTHNYTIPTNYYFVDDNINMGGVRTVACSNTECKVETEESFDQFIKALGYSVTEFESTQNATITASFVFNAQDLIDYSDYLSEAKGKRVKFEYGILIYIDGQVSGAPLSKNGTESNNVVKANLTRVNGINDFSVPKIGQKNYDQGICFCAYMIFGSDIYYIQGDNVYTASEYKSLKPVTVNMILGNE